MNKLLKKILKPLKSAFECESEAAYSEDITPHIEELIIRIRRSIFAFLISVLIVVFFPINWISCPLFGVYCSPNDVGNIVGAEYLKELLRWLGYIPAMVALLRVVTVAIDRMGITPIICNAEGLMNAYVVIIIWGALILSLPYIVYQMLCYIWPALEKHERRMIRNGILSTVGLFLLGEVFAITIVVPFGLQLVVIFGQVAGAEVRWCLSDVINFVIFTSLVTGLSFLLPIVVYYLVLLGILRPEQLKGRNLRIAFLVIMFIAAVITPGGTGVSMLAIGIPMFVLYYLAIIMAEKAMRERESQANA
ncbi:hypothetical protein EYM_03575 [Ignicoccus islandicus DSM 13165]|uniref:Sec-independent protein translocase protein TatC n=1 Tax=Ignicoccus islandicus DSM 13165 TaxID=940295 RepID=A0A0U3F8V5_9CREN|nr:twin-arginine translocase subunit TatC [Ignicoccus islandicus]ALU12424.1 hypothetical protein EYM_03575 [Ignicoccus islandicus DSM 13165]